MCKYILNIRHRNGESSLVRCENDDELEKRVDDAQSKPETTGYQVFSLLLNIRKKTIWSASDDDEEQEPQCRADANAEDGDGARPQPAGGAGSWGAGGGGAD